MSFIKKYKFSLLSLFLLLCLFTWIAPHQNTVNKGSAEIYWNSVCGTNSDPYEKSALALPRINNWYFYVFQGHHGQYSYKVQEKDLLKSIDQLFLSLDNKISSNKLDPLHDSYNGLNNKSHFINCRKLRKQHNSDPHLFLEAINSKITQQNNSSERSKWIVDGFHHQWHKSKLYWATILFEVAFLSFWWLFTFASGIFGKLNDKAYKRIAFSPLFLFIPYYLGYAPYLFSFGAQGGILYPLFAMIVSEPFSWMPFNSFDIALLGSLPKFLVHIAPVPVNPAAVSFHSSVSPSSLILFALLILGLRWCYIKIIDS